MAPAPGRSGTAAEALAVLALVLAAALLLHVPQPRVPLVYDMVGYAAQAHGLLAGHGNTIAMGGEHLPGIYPIGLPALAAAAMAIFGPDLRNGLLAVLACALLTLPCVHLAVRRAGGSPSAGLAASLAVLCSPLFRTTSGYLMSQVPTALAVALVLWLFLARDSARALFLAGLLAALSLLLRYANLSLPAGIVLAELLCGGSRAIPRRRALLALGAGLLLGGAALLLHNAVLYGGPLRTGYRLWGWDVEGQFSLRNVLDAPGTAKFKGEHILLSSFFGLTELASVPMVVAAAIGICFCWRDGRAGAKRSARPSARLLGGACACTLAASYALLAGYSFRSETYLVPTVPVLAMLGGYGAARLLESTARARAPGSAAARVGVLAPVLAAGLLAVSVARAPGPTAEVEESVVRFQTLQRAGLELPAGAALVTTADPGLVEPLFRRAAAREVLYLGPYVAPLVEQRTLAQLGVSALEPQHVVAWAQGQLAAGHAVYLDQNPPPRGMVGMHVAIRTALRAAFALAPASGGDPPTDIPNLFALTARSTPPAAPEAAPGVEGSPPR